MTFVTPGTDSLPTGQYVVKGISHNLNKTGVGITVRFTPEGMGIFAGQESLPTDVYAAASYKFWALLRYVTVLGKPSGGKLVSLTNDNTGTGSGLYDLANYNKLVDTNFGLPSVTITDDLGEVTDDVAERVGRAALKELLQRGVTREYEFDTELATLPLPGETILMADGFTGVCVETSMSMSGGKETVNITLVDMST